MPMSCSSPATKASSTAWVRQTRAATSLATAQAIECSHNAETSNGGASDRMFRTIVAERTTLRTLLKPRITIAWLMLLICLGKP